MHLDKFTFLFQRGLLSWGLAGMSEKCLRATGFYSASTLLINYITCLYPKRWGWLVNSLSMWVLGTLRIRRSIFSWKAYNVFCSDLVSCIVSNPWGSLVLKAASNTRSLHFTVVRVCDQKGCSCKAVALTAPSLCIISLWLSTESVKVAPR